MAPSIARADFSSVVVERTDLGRYAHGGRAAASATPPEPPPPPSERVSLKFTKFWFSMF